MIPRKGLHKKSQNEIHKSKSKPPIKPQYKHKDMNHNQHSNKLNDYISISNYSTRDSNQKLICESHNSAGLESICCRDLKNWNICPIF